MKKAIAITELTILILAIVTGIGLLTFTKQITEKVDCQKDIDICKSTYAFFQRWRVLGYAGMAPRMNCIAISPPNCKEKELETENKRETMHVIAENLRHCWSKTLGNENMMGEDFAYNLFGVAGKDVDFCLVCSEFTPNVDISASEWNDYLKNKKIPKTNILYDDFITPVGEEIWSKKRYKDIGFKKGIRYYVVSVSAETIDNSEVYIYIDPKIDCGKTYPQIHYQLK